MGFATQPNKALAQRPAHKRLALVGAPHRLQGMVTNVGKSDVMRARRQSFEQYQLSFQQCVEFLAFHFDLLRRIFHK
jgi:hypothetical protein